MTAIDPAHLDDVALATASYYVDTHHPDLTGDEQMVVFFRIVFLVKTAVVAYAELLPSDVILRPIPQPSVN